MKIRRYQGKDRKAVKELISNVLTEIFKVKPEKGLEDLENIRENFQIFLVAEDKGKIVGTAGLNKKGIGKRMYVHKKYRNKGIAQKLYNKIEEFARKKKFKKFKLSTTPQMKAAIKFYKKNGFKKVKEDKKTNQIFFEKELK